MAKFDWRADLGGPLLPAGDQSPHSHATTQSQTIPAQRDDSVWPDTMLDVTALPYPDMVKSVRKSGKPRTWLVAAIALFVGMGLWVVLGTDLLDDVPLVAVPEPAAVPAAGAAAPTASEPVAIVAPPVDQPAPTVVHEPVAPPVPVHSVTTVREVTTTPAEPKKPRTDAAREKANSKPRPANKPAPAPAKTEPAAAARELCADANFLLRPMCIHQECQKAQNAKLPVCIEDRLRYPTGPGPARP